MKQLIKHVFITRSKHAMENVNLCKIKMIDIAHYPISYKSTYDIILKKFNAVKSGKIYSNMIIKK